MPLVLGPLSGAPRWVVGHAWEKQETHAHRPATLDPRPEPCLQETAGPHPGDP